MAFQVWHGFSGSSSASDGVVSMEPITTIWERCLTLSFRVGSTIASSIGAHCSGVWLSWRSRGVISHSRCLKLDMSTVKATRNSGSALLQSLSKCSTSSIATSRSAPPPSSLLLAHPPPHQPLPLHHLLHLHHRLLQVGKTHFLLAHQLAQVVLLTLTLFLSIVGFKSWQLGLPFIERFHHHIHLHWADQNLHRHLASGRQTTQLTSCFSYLSLNLFSSETLFSFLFRWRESKIEFKKTLFFLF